MGTNMSGVQKNNRDNALRVAASHKAFAHNNLLHCIHEQTRMHTSLYLRRNSKLIHYNCNFALLAISKTHRSLRSLWSSRSLYVHHQSNAPSKCKVRFCAAATLQCLLFTMLPNQCWYSPLSLIPGIVLCLAELRLRASFSAFELPHLI